MKISNIHARELLDSRGNPTIEVDLELDNEFVGSAIVPSGASTGEHEAVELRDRDSMRFLGNGVLQAVKNVNIILAQALNGQSFDNQSELDSFLIDIDSTENKSRLGANSILGVSMAFARASAKCNQISFYKSFQSSFEHILPTPMMNIVNGGSHANNNIDFQEFMIFPIGAESFSHSIQMGVEVFQHLKILLNERELSTAVGDEGGFAPNLRSNHEAIEIILEAITKASFVPGKDIFIALDAAASEFYNENVYYLESNNSKLSSGAMIDYLSNLVKQYPIISIEDGLDENDWDGWKYLTEIIGKNVQLVGDDLFVTNTKRLKKGIDENIANSILIKVNQIGSLSETIDAVNMAHEAGYTTVMSHRSGETEDNTIADLSVALGCGQIKTGSISRSDRIAKYNQLLRIEEELAEVATFPQTKAFKINL